MRRAGEESEDEKKNHRVRCRKWREIGVENTERCLQKRRETAQGAYRHRSCWRFRSLCKPQMTMSVFSKAVFDSADSSFSSRPRSWFPQGTR
eukprot:2918582-Rhodomonas_salina.5